MIEPQNTRVSMLYTVKLADGEIIKGDPAIGLEHMDFVTGYNQALPGLEARLIGHEAGEEFAFMVPAAEAFGEHDPSLVQEKSFQDMPEARDFSPGRWVLARNPHHRISCGFLVREKRENSAVLDYNHPLAGKDLHYRVRIIEARPATQEELELLKPCWYDPQAEMAGEAL